MFCVNCGRSLLETDQFCEGCGTKVEEEVKIDGNPPVSAEAGKKKAFPILALIIPLIALLVLGGGALAVWQLGIAASPEYTVTFRLNDGTGTIHEEVLVEEGAAVREPRHPSRAGYSFLYWTTDRGGNFRHNFDLPITGETALYAQWEATVEPPPMPPESGPGPPAEPEEDREEVIPEPEEVSVFDITAISDVISRRTDSENVAVAVMHLDAGAVYLTANGDTRFIAAGFYTPLHNIAITHDNSLRQIAGTMMSGMSNADANEIMEHLGGFDQINAILRSQGYTYTSFHRNFGDTAASARGFENYTTAREAVRLLEELYVLGGATRMGVDLTRDGITLPRDVTVFAHSGRGIGEAFNVFALVTAPWGNYVVAILTDNIGVSGAVPIVSALFEIIHQQMEQVYG